MSRVADGVSWVKPAWLYGEVSGRVRAFRQGLRECLRIYLVVAVLLFAAAVLEAATLTLINR